MPTKSCVVHTQEHDSLKAGEYLGKEIALNFKMSLPQVVILFCSSRYDYPLLLSALQKSAKPELLIGCSSAGEFITGKLAEGSACAIAISSDHIYFSAGIAQDLSRDPENAGKVITSSFHGMNSSSSLFRSALVLTDALSGNADEFLDILNHETGSTYQFFGGGAGDDGKFHQTHVFFGCKAYTNAAVALEILSESPLGIGVRHDWEAASEAMRVTETKGTSVLSLNGIPVLEVYEAYAAKTQQKFDPKNPVPFFLHNIMGIDTGVGYKLRVPLTVQKDEGINFAAEIPEGSIVKIMRSSASAEEAVKAATVDAVKGLQGRKPQLAIFFDCVATRFRLGINFKYELEALNQALLGASYAGCNTYGQIALSDGQFSGFHNCTAVVCVLPE